MMLHPGDPPVEVEDVALVLAAPDRGLVGVHSHLPRVPCQSTVIYLNICPQLDSYPEFDLQNAVVLPTINSIKCTNTLFVGTLMFSSHFLLLLIITLLQTYR